MALAVLRGDVGAIRHLLMRVSHNVYLSLRGKLQGIRNIPCFTISLSCLGPLPCRELLVLHPPLQMVFSIAKGKVQLQFLGKMTAEILVNGNSTAAVQNITPSHPPSPPFTPMSSSPPMLVFMLCSQLAQPSGLHFNCCRQGCYAFWELCFLGNISNLLILVSAKIP